MIAHAQGLVCLQSQGLVCLQRKTRLVTTRSVAYVICAAVLFAIISQSGCSGTVGASPSTSQNVALPQNVISGLNPSTTSLSFGNVNLGGTSILVVTFTNTSSSNVTVSSVTIGGAGFSVVGMSNGVNLSPGSSVAMNVSFTPSAVGPVSGSIAVTDNASNPTVTIVLSGTGATGHTARVSWNKSTSANVSGYYIYRGTTTGGPYSRLNGSLPDQSTTSIDGTVQSGQTYYYVVTAVAGNGLESAFSNEASAFIP
jgi:hypothetical protein